jgi:poly(A) polymerase
MATLGVGPGPAVGDALAFLTELRLDEGLVGPDAARRCLEEWWATRR